MKKILFLVFQLFAISATAQHLPVQGRLILNNAPLANGTYPFALTLTRPNEVTPFWTESQNVPVINGLYNLVLGAVNRLPSKPFGTQDRLTLSVSVNGNLVDNITIYPPLERDLAFRDSIDWSKVTHKPPLDTQKLSISGRNITISGGNTIPLPANPATQADSTFQVGQAGNRTQTGLNQNASTGTITLRSIWQSFTFEQAVELVQIQIRCANFNATSVRLKLYNGIGNNSQAILDLRFPAATFQPVMSLQSLNLQLPQSLNANANYTFEVLGEFADILFDVSTNNPYWIGGAGSSAGTVNYSITDLRFTLIVNRQRGFALRVDSTTVTMDVERVMTTGRYYDKTGLVMPVGTILPYGGSNVPQGWFVCDGNNLSRLVYRDLFEAIGTNWGSGDNSTTFNLPDLRGLFLRGYSVGGWNDPDKDSRTNAQGQIIGNRLGSYQWDELRSHNHYDRWLSSFNGGLMGYEGKWGTLGNNDVVKTSVTGGSETRPKNASVLYIIKY